MTLTRPRCLSAAPDRTSGWGVGHAHEIRDRATRTAAEQLGIRPWMPGARDHFVKITSERVAGRAFGHGKLG